VGGTCTDGACICPEDLENCDGFCADLTTSLEHCTECFNACGAFEDCEEDGCVCNYTQCDDGCSNLEVDANNCGECGNACRSDQICGDSECVCPEGEEECDELCVNLDTDTENCGGCGIACRSDEVCDNGDCECPAGETDCDGMCVNTSTDTENCGECGNECRNDQICDNECTCRESEGECDGECVNLSTSDDNCGSCGNVCPASEDCWGGACFNGPCDDLCQNPTVLNATGEGFRADDIGTNSRCWEVRGYLPAETEPRIVCWEFAGGRQLRVDGVAVPCTTGYGQVLETERGAEGGHCIQVTAGDHEFAGFILPNLEQ
jgi:hypothetical protein